MLAAAGYEAVTLGLVLDAGTAGRRFRPARSSSSFDDGYRSQVTAARPILATRRWPGVLNLDLSNLTPSWGVGRAGSGGQWPLVGRSIARSLTHPTSLLSTPPHSSVRWRARER